MAWSLTGKKPGIAARLIYLVAVGALASVAVLAAMVLTRLGLKWALPLLGGLAAGVVVVVMLDRVREVLLCLLVLIVPFRLAKTLFAT